MRHAEDFAGLLHELRARGVLSSGKVDLVGFSFGARVAASIAAHCPDLVHRVVLTGIPADRGPLGRTILKAWLATLGTGNLEAFVWQSIVDGHSESFLRQHESRLEGWVASAIRQNRCDAIHALVQNTHFDDPAHPQHTTSLVRKARENGVEGLLIGASLDRLAPAEEVQRLAEVARWPCEIIDGAGHSVPIEKPQHWRGVVGHFLDFEIEPHVTNADVSTV